MGLGLTYLFDTYLREVVGEFGWSRASFSAAHSSRLVVLALASPLAGWVTERLGPRVVLGAGLVLLSAVGMAYGGVDALWQIWALSLAIGLVMAALGDVAVAAVVSRWIDRGRGLALGIVYSGSNVGGMIAVLASAWIIESYGWRASASYLAGCGSLALLPFALWVVRMPEGPAEVAKVALRESRVLEEEGGSLELVAAVRTRSFWLLFGALFFFYFYYIAVLDHLVAFLQDVGLSRTAASQAFGATIVLGVGSKVGIGVLFDRLPARVGLLVNFSVLAVASVLLALLPAPGVLLPFVIGHGAAVAAQNVTYPVVVAYCFGVAAMARIYGVLMLALLFGGLGGSIFAGAVFDSFGTYRPAWVVFGLGNFLSVAMLAMVRREPRPASPRPPESGSGSLDLRSRARP